MNTKKHLFEAPKIPKQHEPLQMKLRKRVKEDTDSQFFYPGEKHFPSKIFKCAAPDFRAKNEEELGKNNKIIRIKEEKGEAEFSISEGEEWNDGYSGGNENKIKGSNNNDG